MFDINTENQLRNANTEQKRRIDLLEEMLLENKITSEALHDSEKRYRRLFESAKDGILILDAETGMVADVNPFLIKLLGYTYEEFCGKHIWEVGAFKDIAASKDAFQTLQDNEYIRYEDLPLETHDGQLIAVEFVSNVYLVDHSKVIQCNIRDITSQKRAKAERKRLMAAIDQVGEAIVITDAQGNILFVNPAFELLTGFSSGEAVDQNMRILKSGEHDEAFYRNLWGTISGGITWTGRMVNKRKDGNLYTVETTISPVRDALNQIVNYVAVKRDITEHIRLTKQLQQSQKMEVIGQLAGGVAHDFNNMLSVILGNAELALLKLAPSQPLQIFLYEIIEAAKHSAAITRQLLAFARKQTNNPVILDLSHNVETMLKMLQRLIGENIHLNWLPDKDQCPVRMDPVQVDQILTNLCINARDAIHDDGTITIETGNTFFDEKYCAQHAGYAAGDYVLLAISDDGCGMKKEVIDHIFEPFFTTKEEGQGTGLGLSTVYGIVKQNDGFINVYSESGTGTTFRIYLPRRGGRELDALKGVAGAIPQGYGETILVVEDEPALLMVAAVMLEELGYVVLTAVTPSEAISLAEEHAGEILLLIADIIMPEMSGLKLSVRLQSIYPDMKILFMSGYTANMIAHRGVLNKDAQFIQKPFAMKDLAEKVRDALKL